MEARRDWRAHLKSGCHVQLLPNRKCPLKRLAHTHLGTRKVPLHRRHREGDELFRSLADTWRFWRLERAQTLRRKPVSLRAVWFVCFFCFPRRTSRLGSPFDAKASGGLEHLWLWVWHPYAVHPLHAVANPWICRRTRLTCLLCGWRAGGPLAIQRFQLTRMASLVMGPSTLVRRQNVEWLGLEISDRFVGSKVFHSIGSIELGVGPGLACTKPIFAVVACGILRPGDGQRQSEKVWRNDRPYRHPHSLPCGDAHSSKPGGCALGARPS